ncbi:MAG: hypothetical protein OEZ65_08320 [Gemmatimonadota bacterium]|nr:hypothetical protein [Gemmatimonadota bacterium]
MDVLGWIALLAVGIVISVLASMRTVKHARALVQGSRIPPFFVGVTLLAVGTDLPEIANSIVSCAAGHGDLNAGDSIGSAMTQASLVLGLLPLVGGAFDFQRRRVVVISAVTVAGLACGILMMRDGDVGRVDALAFLGCWLLGSMIVWRHLAAEAAGPADLVPVRGKVHHAAAALGWLALVGLGAGGAVSAFVRLSTLLGVPEFVLSFFVASIGTSLPELVLDVTALRAGLKDMALGDVVGSCFVDATLSIGIGPLFFPSAVTATLVTRGSLTAIGVMVFVALLAVVARRHTRVTGMALVGLYVGVYFVLLG